MSLSTPISTIFQLYRESVLLVEVPGENQTCHKSLTNFITMLYRVHLA